MTSENATDLRDFKLDCTVLKTIAWRIPIEKLDYVPACLPCTPELEVLLTTEGRSDYSITLPACKSLAVTACADPTLAAEQTKLEGEVTARLERLWMAVYPESTHHPTIKQKSQGYTIALCIPEAPKLFNALRDEIQMEDGASALLILNPFNYTAWNVRKSSCLARSRDWECTYNAVEREFRFCECIQSKHPKPVEIWEHRRWCLKLLFSHATDDQEIIRLCIFRVFQEIQAASRACAKRPRNYNAWNHRLLVVQSAASLLRSKGYESLLFALYRDELETTLRLSRVAPQDYSCLHYRVYLITQLEPMESFAEVQKELLRLQECDDSSAGATAIRALKAYAAKLSVSVIV